MFRTVMYYLKTYNSIKSKTVITTLKQLINSYGKLKVIGIDEDLLTILSDVVEVTFMFIRPCKPMQNV